MGTTGPRDREESSTLTRAVKPGFFYGYVITAAVFVMVLVRGGIYISTFGVFFKPVLTEFRWTRAEATLGFSLSWMVQGTLAIFMGWLTDRMGPRAVVMVFGSFLGITYLLLSQVNTLWQFQLYYALAGAVGLSALIAPPMSTIARWFVKKRSLMTGIAQAGIGVGGLIFTPLAGWLIMTCGWRSTYVILGIIMLAGIIISGLFLRRDPKEMGQLPDGISEITEPETKRQSPGLQAVEVSLREAIHTSQFWMIAGLFFSFGFCRTTFMTHIAAHVQDLGFSLSDGANILAAITGASIIGRIGMGRVADIVGNRRAFMMSFAATAITLVWALATSDLWGLYLFALVFGFGWGAQAVLRFAVTSEVFGLVSLGLRMGVFILIESAAATIGSYFAGYIFDTVGNYNPIFGMGIAISVTGIILAWLLKPAIKERSDS